VIVRAEAGNFDELGKLVVARVQAVEGITRALILIADCPWPPHHGGHGQS
jgi:hypothetical protein